MTLTLDKWFSRSPGSFTRAARSRGVRSRVANALEPAARELFPNHPEEVLTSRQAFEQAAMHAVVGDAGNLELSFSLVDVLASAVETLGLARASDVPDPFRRVWVRSTSGARKRGVVIRCESGEVAVFCPPSQDRFTDAGHMLKLSYRGFSSSVEYDLMLNDLVRLPEAVVLHLTRPEGGGAIGRDQRRMTVDLKGKLRVPGAVESGEQANSISCQVLDASAGGLRIASDSPLAPGRELEVELLLPGEEEPIALRTLVCWNRTDDSDRRTQGLQVTEHSTSAAAAYERHLHSLLAADLRDQQLIEDDIRAPGLPASASAALPGEVEPAEAQVLRLEPEPSIPREHSLPAPGEPEPTSQIVDSLRAELHQRKDEIERQCENVEQMVTSLDAATERAKVQKHNIEELATALEEAKLELAVKSKNLIERGASKNSAVSLVEMLKRKFDELESTLALEEKSENKIDDAD